VAIEATLPVEPAVNDRGEREFGSKSFPACGSCAGRAESYSNVVIRAAEAVG
jgi:hypothetical protein